jgi:hypothetical protein
VSHDAVGDHQFGNCRGGIHSGIPLKPSFPGLINAGSLHVTQEERKVLSGTGFSLSAFWAGNKPNQTG